MSSLLVQADSSNTAETSKNRDKWLLVRLFILVSFVTVGSGSNVHHQLGTVAAGSDQEVMQGHNTRKAGDTADESPKVMIGAYHGNIDRQFNVVLLADFCIEADIGELQATADTLNGNIVDKAGHFGFTRQLAQQGAE